MRRNWPSFKTIVFILVLLSAVVFLGPPTLRWFQASNFPYDLNMLRYVEDVEEPNFPIVYLLHSPFCPTCIQFLPEFEKWRQTVKSYVWVREVDVTEKRSHDLIAKLYQRVFNAKRASTALNISDNLPLTIEGQRSTTPIFIFDEKGSIKLAGDLNDVWYKKNPEGITITISEYVAKAIGSGAYQPIVGRGDEGLDILQERPATYNLEARTRLFPFLPIDQGVSFRFRLSLWPWQFAWSIPSTLVPAFGNEMFFNPDGSPKECSNLEASYVKALIVAGSGQKTVRVRSAPVWDPSYQNEKHLQRNCGIKFGGEIKAVSLVSIVISTKDGYEVWWVIKDNLVPLTQREQGLMAKAHETLPVQTGFNPGNPGVEATKVVTVEVTVEVPVQREVLVVVTATPVPVVYYSTVVTMTQEMREQGRQGLGAWLYAEPFENITPEEEVSLRQGFISFGEVVTLRDYNDSWVVLEVKTVTHDQLRNPYEVIVPRYLLKAFASGPWQEVQP